MFFNLGHFFFLCVCIFFLSVFPCSRVGIFDELETGGQLDWAHKRSHVQNVRLVVATTASPPPRCCHAKILCDSLTQPPLRQAAPHSPSETTNPISPRWG